LREDKGEEKKGGGYLRWLILPFLFSFSLSLAHASARTLVYIDI
jgi:hypothetical protein